VRARFGLPGTPHKPLAFYAMWRSLSFFAKLRGLIGKTSSKWLDLRGVALLHGTAPSQQKAGAQPAFSSPIEANGPGGDL
jgi:hypothetical protein